MVSWQLLQLPVMPVWIWAVVGAGVANSVPGADLVAEAATMPVGVVPKWQVSQLVDDGICEVAPIGEVGGSTTMRVTPAKLEPVMLGPWHCAQLLVMPLWLIKELLNLAPFPTGVAAMLEPVPTWQDSQAAVVGRWLAGGPTMAKLAAGIAKPATTLAAWHWAQLVVVLGALAWMLASVGSTEKSLEVWQAVHCAVAEVGMWLAGLAATPEKLIPAWHCEQSPLVG